MIELVYISTYGIKLHRIVYINPHANEYVQNVGKNLNIVCSLMNNILPMPISWATVIEVVSRW